MIIKSILMPGKSVIVASILSMLVFAGCDKNLEEPSALNQDSSSANAAAQALEHVPNELLVKLKAGLPEEAKAQVLARIGGQISEKILTKSMERFNDREGVLLVRTPLAVFEAINKLKGGAEILYAEPNYIFQHNATSNDSYFTNGSLWGMYGDATSPANQFGSQAGEAWAANKIGSGTVVIGIIDEGVMHTHEDLNANIWRNPGETAGNGVDDDKNGYVDDVYGWDFDGNNNTTYDGTSDDHGTHVAGTIGAVGGNGKGVAGVTWNVKMVTAKFIGRNGGTLANAIKAVDYMTDLKTRHKLNMPATNNSWGGGGYSQALYDAIERANAANVLFVAAAGNNGINNDATASYPANYANANIIAVASITSTGALSSFSNYGFTTVDLAAPGSAIYSTIPGNSNKSSYGSYNGTSMATPHVTGAVALYASIQTTVPTAAVIKNAIISSVVPTSSLTGKTVTGGRLDANAALSK